MIGTSKSVARREREVARTREDILWAAATAFARSGLDATTMNEIAKEAGYTAPSLYSYFRSKEEIVEGLFDRVRSEFRGVFDQPVPAGLPFRQRIDLIVRRQLELLDERRDAVVCFLSLTPACGAPAKSGAAKLKLPLTGFELHAKRLADWLEVNASAEELGGYPAEDAAYALMGIQHAFFRRWLGGSRKARLADRTDLILTMFLHGIAGVATDPREGKKKR